MEHLGTLGGVPLICTTMPLLYIWHILRHMGWVFGEHTSRVLNHIVPCESRSWSCLIQPCAPEKGGCFKVYVYIYIWKDIHRWIILPDKPVFLFGNLHKDPVMHKNPCFSRGSSWFKWQTLSYLNIEKLGVVSDISFGSGCFPVAKRSMQKPWGRC